MFAQYLYWLKHPVVHVFLDSPFSCSSPVFDKLWYNLIIIDNDDSNGYLEIKQILTDNAFYTLTDNMPSYIHGMFCSESANTRG